MILAGDIGGTKTNVGLFRAGGEEVRRATYVSGDHPGLLPIVKDFLGPDEVRAACFGIAGPVIENRCRTPNLAWEVDGAAVGQQAGIGILELINDLQATAEGIPALAAEDLVDLNEGAVADGGTVALIAAGTGLGMALVARADGRWLPLASEGGHQSFAPRNAAEGELLSWLRGRFGRVSIERVVSGPGLHHIYDFLIANGRHQADPAVADLIRAGDPAAVIAQAGLDGSCPVCSEALDMFLAALGAAAGDLALVTLATGGLYVGGGIAPKLRTKIADGTFLAAFLDKGRLRHVVKGVPVHLITNPRTAVLGAARRALRTVEAAR